jgi:YbgC/YbaW family acyl-CoA thioester hydrolase
MESIERIVCVSDTDCTGALYFTSMLKFTQEAFESYLSRIHPHVAKSFHEQKIAFPIVHTEASFLSPIYLGENLTIRLDVEFKNTSFVVSGEIFSKGKKKGLVYMTHVCLDLKLKKKVEAKSVFKLNLV